MGGRHGGRRGEAHPAALPGWPHLARTPHLVDEAVVYQLSSQVLGTVGCGRGGGGVRPAVLPTCSHPHPGATFTPWPTWEQVVGELPMQPVLQHQEQSELRRRRQEGVVGSRSALSLFSRTRCLCRRQAPPPPKLTCQRAWSSLLSRLHCIWITCGEDAGQGHSKAGPQPLAARVDAASKEPGRGSKDQRWEKSLRAN